MAIQSLTELKGLLDRALASPALFSLVNTRVMLKTGVDLGSIRAQEDGNVETVTKVVNALEAMGFSADTLMIVSRRKQ